MANKLTPNEIGDYIYDTIFQNKNYPQADEIVKDFFDNDINLIDGEIEQTKDGIYTISITDNKRHKTFLINIKEN